MTAPETPPPSASPRPPTSASRRPLSQLDAFFVAYQERACVAMQLGVEVEMSGAVIGADVDRALDAVIARWPQLGQRLHRRAFGLIWRGPAQRAAMLERAAVSAEDPGAQAALHRWRNRPIDPFAAPPFQLLWLAGDTRSLLAFRAHHAACDGQAFFAACVYALEVLCGRGPVRQADTATDLFDPALLWRGANVPAMIRHVAWLVRESRAGRSARLAIRAVTPGDVSTRDLRLDRAASARVNARAAAAGVSPALLTAAAWIRAIGRWNRVCGHLDPAPVSLEMPISARRSRRQDAAMGNYISPLVLFADASAPLADVARALTSQVREGVRQRHHLAMPLVTAPSRWMPWSLYRRVAANTTFSGFSTSHFTWLDTIPDCHARLRAHSQDRLYMSAQRIYTPVCLHMGAALAAIPWDDGTQLFLTYRDPALSHDDARALLALAIAELDPDSGDPHTP